jgi:hypothetical protein
LPYALQSIDDVGYKDQAPESSSHMTTNFAISTAPYTIYLKRCSAGAVLDVTFNVITLSCGEISVNTQLC